MGVLEFSTNTSKRRFIFSILKKCWSHVVPCRELPGWHTPDQTMHDEHGTFHGERKQFIQNGVVLWKTLCKEF